MQQSAAFKILRTRLKTVPSYAFSRDQISRSSSGNPFTNKFYMTSGFHASEDGEIDEDSHNTHSGMNFPSRLQQFEQMQHQHRLHSRSQAQLRHNAMSASKVRKTS